MSRVFDGNIANHLIASSGLAEAATEGAMGVWFKKTTFSGDEAFLTTGSGSSGRRWIGVHTGTGYPWGFGAGSSVDLEGDPASFVSGTWQLILMRKDAAGDWFLHVDSDVTGPINDSTFFIGANSDIRLGGSTSDTMELTAKLAHAFIFARDLTNSEISGLVAGNDPSGLDPAGRLAYYPLTSSSLDNEWQADSGVGALTVNGTVATDADNPAITAVPTLSLDNATRTPGSTISGTATNFSAEPTSITLSDGASPDYEPSLSTTADGDDWDFSATIEDFAAQAKAAGEGTPVQGLIPGTITVTVE